MARMIQREYSITVNTFNDLFELTNLSDNMNITVLDAIGDVRTNGGTVVYTYIADKIGVEKFIVDAQENGATISDASAIVGYGLLLEVDGDLGVDTNIIATKDFVSTASVATAGKLTTERSISLDGDVTGSVNFDGSANVSITATVADDSHNHIISNVDGLQTALDGKVDENTAITAGTATKITYDAKGLVTAGATLASTDIPNLDASKITTGTLAVARGGTGTTTSTGTGSVVLSNSPTLVTPSIGVATGTSLSLSVADGTAPLTITSTTAVSNLNADMVDGKHVGTFGNAIPLLDGANTFSNTQTITANSATSGLSVSNAGTGYGIYTDDIRIAAGTALLPSIAFNADLDTGIYFPATGQVGITTAGTQAAYFDASGNTNIAGNLGVRAGVPTAGYAITSSMTESAAGSRYGIDNQVYTDNTVALGADRVFFGAYNLAQTTAQVSTAHTQTTRGSMNIAQLNGDGGYTTNGEGIVEGSENQGNVYLTNRSFPRCETAYGNLSGVNFNSYKVYSVTSTIGTNICTTTDTTNLTIGDIIWACTQITVGTTITGITDATTFTISANAIGTGTDASTNICHKAGILDNAWGSKNYVRHQDYGGVITTAYGVHAEIDNDYTTAGSIGTAYGVYIDFTNPTAVTNGWGLYQINTNLSKGNYFGSKVYINSVTDDTLGSKLQVNGTITATTPTAGTNNTTVATTAFVANAVASGGGAINSAFYENSTSISANYTITAGKNAGTFGPITIANGVVVTIPDGSTWTIV